MLRRDRVLLELEALYRARFTHFVRVATAIAPDEEAAREAVQEAFASALRNHAAYRGDGPLEAWVWRAVVNAARKARALPTVAALADEPRASANGRAPEPSEVGAAIAALPERQRLAVFLRYYADLDYRTIAGALGVEVGTVSAMLSAAHAALRRTLREVPR